MRRDFEDLHAIRHEHIAIHEELLNWGGVVRVSQHLPNACAPIFKLYRTDPHYMDEPPTHLPRRPLDGFEMEKAVRKLPEKNREAIRWVYVRWHRKAYDVRKELGVTALGLADLIHCGRSMLTKSYKKGVVLP